MFRRQDHYIASLYNQQIKDMGRNEPLVINIENLKINKSFDWYDIANAWASVFGKDFIDIKIYESLNKMDSFAGSMFRKYFNTVDCLDEKRNQRRGLMSVRGQCFVRECRPTDDRRQKKLLEWQK